MKLLYAVTLAVCFLIPKPGLSVDDYQDYQAITEQLQAWQRENPDLLKLEAIGKSRGGKEIWLVRIAAAGMTEPDKRPGMFIGANVEGNYLLGTEAAMATVRYLIDHADETDVKELLETRCFYIAPLINPDVAEFYFAEPRYERRVNATPVNNDRDLATDEDGPGDVNGDGFITQMRYKHPEGVYIVDPDDKRLMRKADPIKGERGEFKLVTEGTDDDGDGEINEDPQGGVHLNDNFPHDYRYFADTSGLYPVSEPEAIALLEFFINHRNIALVFTFSGENNLINLQKGKGPAKIGAEKVKVPERYARFIGLDPEREFTISEIVEFVKTLPFTRGMDITEEMVASFLGLGPVMSIPDEDYKYYEEISKRYKKMLEEKKIDDPKRKAKAATGDGSFTTWAYYQYGVPAFTIDLWAVPKEKKEKKEEEEEAKGLTLDKLKTMTPEEFLELGEEEIAKFLKEINAPSRFSAKMVIGAVKDGMITPQKMAEMVEKMGGAARQEKEGEAEESYVLKWAEQNVDEGGFIPWEKYDHPSLGEVEIGGMKPYLKTVPPYTIGKSVLEPNAEFVIKLAADIPTIEIIDLNVKALDSDLYEVTAYVRNNGFFPTAFRHGVTSKGVAPIIFKLEVEQENLVGGVPINRINSIPGHGISKKFRWLVKAKKSTELVLSAGSVKSGSDTKTIVLK